MCPANLAPFVLTAAWYIGHRIAFQSDEEKDIEESLVSRYALNRGIAETLRPLLVDDLKSTNDEKRSQIERFVVEAPEYRALTNPRYAQLLEQKVQPGLSSDKLDEALLHVKREIEDGVRKELRRSLKLALNRVELGDNLLLIFNRWKVNF